MSTQLIEKGKKALTVGLATTTIAWTLGLAALAPASALTLVTGDLIQGSGKAVYWFTADGHRMPFPNEKVYKSWFADFSTVRKITDDELRAIPLASGVGANVTYRPGTRLVKITTDPKTYAVEPGPVLRWVKSEADATRLYGANWGQWIDDVPDVFFTNYSIGAPLDVVSLTNGRLVKTASSSDIYLVWNGQARKVADYASFLANRFRSEFVSTVDQALLSALPLGSSVTGVEAGLLMPGSSTPITVPTTTTTTTTVTSPTTGSSLSVAVASDTPAAAVQGSGSAFNKALKLNLTAGADGDVKVTSLTIERGGFAQNSAFTGVAAFTDDGVRHGNFVTFTDPDTGATAAYPYNHATLTFSASDAIVVPAGKTIAVWIKTNITTAAAGQSGTYFLALRNAAAVGSTATVSGTFPAMGSTFSLTNGTSIIGTFTVDAVQVHNNGGTDATNVNINLGTLQQEIGRFRFAAGANEDLKILNVTVYNNGNSSDGDVTNISLYGPDGTKLSTVAQTTGRYLTFNLSATPYLLARGVSRDFSVRADVTSGSTRSVRFVIQNDYDVEVMGTSSGASVLPTAAGTNDIAYPVGDLIGASYVNRITIAAGTILFSKSTDAPTGNISAGGNSIVLGKWDVTAVGEDMEIRGMTYNITRSAATNLGGTLKITVNGATVFTVAGSSATYGAATAASLSSFPLLKAGQKATVTVVSDILSTASAGLTYAVALDVTSVKRISTNDILDPAVTETSANTLTVSSASLSLSRNSAFGNTNVVAGQQSAKVGSFIMQAGSTEAVTVSSLTVALSNVTNISNLVLKDGSTVLAPATATPSASNSVSISGLEIPASGTKTIDVYVDTNSSTTGTEVVTLTVSNATGKLSGVTITATGSPATGQTITFGTSGTLTMALNTSTTPTAQLLHSGMTDVTIASLNMTTNNFEDVTLKTLQLNVTNGQATAKDASLKLFDGSTQIGSSTSVVGGLAEFGGLTYTMPKDTTKTLTVKLSTTQTATINSNSMLHVSVAYLEATGASGGATIKPGTTLTTTWSATNATLAGASLTVSSNDGFAEGDVVFYQTTGAAGSNLGLVTGTTGTTGLAVGARSAATFTTAGAVSKIASGAWTTASAGTALRAGAAITVRSTRGFSVGDPVLAYNTTDGAQLGWISAIASDTSMTVRTLADQGAAMTTALGGRVAKLGAGSPVTTSWTAGNVAVTGATSQTVAASTGFNVGDMVLAQCNDQTGTFGIVSAIASATAMTVLGNGAATVGTTCSLVRIGTNANGLNTTAASAGTLLRAGTVNATVTSSAGFGLGDVVLAGNTTDGATLGRVGAAVTTATAVPTLQMTADTTAAVSRLTRLPGAAAASRLMNIHDVEPVLTLAAGSPSGTSTPSTSQEVGRFTLKADGDRDLTYTSLRLRKAGSNSPAQYVTRYDLYITGSSTPLSTVGTTTLVGTTDDGAAGAFTVTGTSVTICTGAVTAISQLGNISAAEYAHMNVGDTLTFDDGSAITATVTSKTGALGACGASTATLVFNTSPTLAADTTINVYSDTVYFDGSVMNNNASVTDISMATQTVTQGSTLNLSVYANTSGVRTGLGAVIATFGLTIPGTAGPAGTGTTDSGASTLTAQDGGLSWGYTPSGGSALTSSASDNYPLNLPTLSY